MDHTKYLCFIKIFLRLGKLYQYLEKEIMSKDKLDNDKKELPSATDDAADVMPKYIKKREKIDLRDKKFKFPPIDYEKPPHF